MKPLLLLLSLSFVFSCRSTKEILNTNNGEENHSKFFVDTSKIDTKCFKSNNIKFPINEIKEILGSEKYAYYDAALCLHNEVKNYNPEASKFYWAMMDEIYNDWVLKKEPSAYFVDSMSTMMTKASFSCLIKFLDVNTNNGGGDVVYEHDGIKIYYSLLNYLSKNDSIYYRNVLANIEQKEYAKHYIKGIETSQIYLPIAFEKSRSIFLSDLAAGKVKLKNEIK